MKHNRFLHRALNLHGLSKDQLPTSKEEWQDFLATVQAQSESIETEFGSRERDLLQSLKFAEKLCASLEQSVQEEKQQTNVELTRQLNYSQALLNAIPGYVSWVNSDLYYVGVNQNLAKIYGLQPKDFIGRKVGFLRHPEQDALEPILKELFASDEVGRVCEFEIDQSEKGKQQYLLSLHRYNGGSEAVIIGIDISEQKRAERALEEQKVKLVQANRLSVLGEMASGVAHEVNTPLMVIQNKAEILRELAAQGPVSQDRVNDSVSMIVKTADRIAAIIRGLRAIARDAEQDPMHEADLMNIVTDTLNLCQKKVENQGVRVQVSNNLQGLKLWCRDVQISQVLLNLVSNAVDAIKDQESPWIKILGRDIGTHIELTVTDSGLGIDEKIAEKIMLPFFTTKEVGHGMGMGLSIASAIVRGHRGQLRLDQASANTRFILVLPKDSRQAPQSLGEFTVKPPKSNAA